jgi:hypothetical protein
MSDTNQPPAESKSGEQPTKKRYGKPEFRFERAFETMALSCGKMNPNLRQCTLNRKVS